VPGRLEIRRKIRLESGVRTRKMEEFLACAVLSEFCRRKTSVAIFKDLHRYWSLELCPGKVWVDPCGKFERGNSHTRARGPVTVNIRTSTTGDVGDLEIAMLFDFREDRKIISRIFRYPTYNSNIQHINNFQQKSSHSQ